MRYAILSDVHANAAALRSVLADAHDAGAERIYCLGDVLGYGPDPVDALQIVHDRAHVCLMGNHDAAACGVFSVDEFTALAANAIRKHRSMLSPKAVAWLKTLPYVCDGPGFACAHGDFAEPERFNYISDPPDAMPSWRTRTEQLLFVGHTHHPGIYVLGPDGEPHFRDPADFTPEEGSRYIVNVGSAGYPRSGECRSFYCIYDDADRSVRFRSIPFDLDGYRKRMSLRGIDAAPWLAARAAERDQPKVRAGADFSNGANQTRERRAFAHTPRSPQPAANAPAPQPSAADPDKSPHGRGLAIILGALLVAFAGVFCTMRLIREMPDKGEMKKVQGIVVKTTAVQPEAESGPRLALDSPIMLSGGWRAYVEDVARQKVRVERNEKANRAAFRIENAVEATVRFTRSISLMEKPKKIRADVELLTSPLPGVKADFSFTAKLEFFADGGRPCGGPRLWSGKVSAKNRDFDVPADAATAALTLDCRSAGTHDIAVPHLAPAPVEAAPAAPPRPTKQAQPARPPRQPRHPRQAKPAKAKRSKAR